jgi:alpha-tubulin suppressor-like RCC1 family protein
MSRIDLESTNHIADKPRAAREAARTRRRLASWLFLAAAVAPSAGCAVATDASGSSEEPLSGSLVGAGAQVGSQITKYRVDPNAIAEIIAGGDQTCVRKYNGSYYCWGYNGNNLLGASGTTCDYYNYAYYPNHPFNAPFPCALQPVLMTAMSAAQLTLGNDHTCARDSAGQAFCWGNDGAGQLGTNNGAYAAQTAPTPVAPALNGQQVTFSDLSAGSGSTCGVESGTGIIYCWGSVTAAANVPVPLLVASNGGLTFNSTSQLAPLTGASKVTTGGNHGCATFSASSGGIWCFGDTGVGGPGWLGGVSRVSTRANFTCVDQPNGTVQCFGDNSWGQLGNGMFANTGTPQTVGGGMALHGVAVGDNHACALDASGAVFCWGLNDDGQAGARFGNVVTTPQCVPTDANGNCVQTNLTFSALAAGSNHTCGLTKTGHVYCWGDNVGGQLGRGFWGSWDFAPGAVPDP